MSDALPDSPKLTSHSPSNSLERLQSHSLETSSEAQRRQAKQFRSARPGSDSLDDRRGGRTIRE